MAGSRFPVPLHCVSRFHDQAWSFSAPSIVSVSTLTMYFPAFGRNLEMSDIRISIGALRWHCTCALRQRRLRVGLRRLTYSCGNCRPRRRTIAQLRMRMPTRQPVFRGRESVPAHAPVVGLVCLQRLRHCFAGDEASVSRLRLSATFVWSSVSSDLGTVIFLPDFVVTGLMKVVSELW